MAAYKRTIYLINPKFQIKFSLFVSSLIGLCSLIYPLVIYEIYNNLVNQITDPQITEKLLSLRVDIIKGLVLFQIVFMILVFVISIFQSHKIAGPLHRLKDHFNRIKENQLTNQLSFRKGDHFQDIAEHYNAAIDSINRSVVKKTQGIENLIKDISSKLNKENNKDKISVYENILERISEIQNNYR